MAASFALNPLVFYGPDAISSLPRIIVHLPPCRTPHDVVYSFEICGPLCLQRCLVENELGPSMISQPIIKFLYHMSSDPNIKEPKTKPSTMNPRLQSSMVNTQQLSHNTVGDTKGMVNQVLNKMSH